MQKTQAGHRLNFSGSALPPRSLPLFVLLLLTLRLPLLSLQLSLVCRLELQPLLAASLFLILSLPCTASPRPRVVKSTGDGDRTLAIWC